MNDDVDIYGDLPSFVVNECVRCKEKSDELTEKNAKFEEESLSWKSKSETFETEKKTILLNTSSLLKTARAEIARKDKTIAELRRELEDLKFKRGIWSRAKPDRSDWRNHKKRIETNFNGKAPSIEVKKPPPELDPPLFGNVSDQEEEDAEQKFQPYKQHSTLYGERLRQKILSEQEAERIEKEKTKLLAFNDPQASLLPLCSEKQKMETLSTNDKAAGKKTVIRKYDATYERKFGYKLEPKHERSPKEEEEFFFSDGSSIIKTDEEFNRPIGKISHDRRSEWRIDESLPDRSHEAGLWKRGNAKSNGGVVNYSEGDHKSYRSTDRRYDEALTSRDERYKDDYYHYQNSNLNQEWRYNSSHESSYDRRSRQPRDEFFHSGDDRRSHKHQDSQYKRQSHEKRSRSNFRGNSKTPERRYNYNKNNDRHRRSEQYREYNEKYTKRREDGLPRDRYNYTEYYNKDDYDLRERPERNYDDKFIDRYDYDDRRSHSSNRARGKSKSPGEKPRNRSDCGSIEENCTRGRKRSRSRGRCRDTESKPEMEKIPEDKKDSRVRKTVDDERHSGDPANLRENHFESTRITPAGPAEDTAETYDLCVESMDLHAEVKISSVDENREGSVENTAAVLETMTSLVHQVETRDKFILMLENDGEIPLSPLTKPEMESIGSRSFREEKIENIEKFIQDYQCDVVHCAALGNDENSEYNEADEFANSTSSIVDTLSMDIDDLVVNDGLENGLVVQSEIKPEINVEATTVERKISQVVTDSELGVKMADEKLKNMEIDTKIDDVKVDDKPNDFSDQVLRDADVDKKDETEDAAIFEKSVIDENVKDGRVAKKITEEEAINNEWIEIGTDKKLGELVIDEKLQDDEIHEISRNFVAYEKSGETKVDEESRDAAVDRISEDTWSDRNLSGDEKSEIVVTGEESSGDAIDKASNEISNGRLLQNDEKSKDDTANKPKDISLKTALTIYRKLEDFSRKIATITAGNKEHPSEEGSLDRDSKRSAIDAKSIVTDDKHDDIDTRTNLKDLELETNAKNCFIDGISSINGNNNELTTESLGKKSENTKICEKPEETISEISPPLPPAALLPPLPPLPPSPPLPPLPASTPLPPLPASPPLPPLPVSTPLPPLPASTPLPPLPASTPLPPLPASTSLPPLPASTPLPPLPASTPLPPLPVSTPLPPLPASTPLPPLPASTPLPPLPASTSLPPLPASTPLPPVPASTPLPPLPPSTPLPPLPPSTPLPPLPASTPLPPLPASTPLPPLPASTPLAPLPPSTPSPPLPPSTPLPSLPASTPLPPLPPSTPPPPLPPSTPLPSLPPSTPLPPLPASTPLAPLPPSTPSPPLPPSTPLPPLPASTPSPPLPPSTPLPPLPASTPLAPLPPSTPSPPLPPSTPLPSLPASTPLPPLPPSPPPEEEEPEISKVHKPSTINSDKQETDKSKQTKNRPRIPCLPIVSLYSRKRRNLVLTDSASSHTIVESLKDENDKIASSKLGESDGKTLPNSMQKSVPQKPRESQSNNSACGAMILSDIPAAKNVAPTVSVSENTTSRCTERKLNSSPSSPIGKDCKIVEDLSSISASLGRRKNAGKSEAKIIDKNVEEARSKNSDGISKNKNAMPSKLSVRGRRAVLKTIVTKVPDGDSASRNRKRPLSKEKENQSKPAKQAKIMIVARRRPIQLEDSSTATTLVSSERDGPIKENGVKSPVKNDAPRRKGRTANS